MKLPGGKKTFGVVIGIFIIIFLGYRFFWYRPPVAVMVVKKVEVQGKVHGPGTVQSKVPVAVSSKITGILEKLNADQGDRVKKGQLLAELDSIELRAREAAAQAAKNRAQRELARAQADMVKAQANLGLAQSNYRRDMEVFKPGYISQAAFDTTKAQLKVAESEVNAFQATVTALQAAVKQAESETHAAEALHNYTRILAPMDGLITSRKAEVGTIVAPGTPIFQMVDLDQVWVAAWIDLAQVAQLREGQPAHITLRSGRVFQGQVVRINKEGDTVTRELEVDVKFEKLPEPLVIGEEAEVNIATGRIMALAVPLTAITERDNKTVVLVVEQGRLVFRPIKAGLNDGKRIAILEGLKEGDLVVAQPANLKPGTRVQPQVKTPESKGK
ncbi:MAG: efflux RND transporter periplasmic adaptor subunit [Deltaproteobacteria bacterium]|nr:MAG: efflux RND transporter periplasmic adaptor subunit [Deltaproteobacteria bacterium]